MKKHASEDARMAMALETNNPFAEFGEKAKYHLEAALANLSPDQLTTLIKKLEALEPASFAQGTNPHVKTEPKFPEGGVDVDVDDL